jgi:hypothetical protein
MTDFQIRSDNVDVEQIMRQIRARIREKRGVDYTEEEIKELARVKLEKFLDPTGVRSDLLAQFRRTKAEMPPVPSYTFEDTTLFESQWAILRFTRKFLRPVLKLFFSPNPLIHALHIQAELNTRNARREELDSLEYELIHNLVLETTRLGIQVKNLKMQVDSMSSRLDFDERRARALEGVVQYRPGAVAPLQPPPQGPGRESREDAQAQERRSRRRRRRGRRPGSGREGGQPGEGFGGGVNETAGDSDDAGGPGGPRPRPENREAAAISTESGDRAPTSPRPQGEQNSGGTGFVSAKPQSVHPGGDTGFVSPKPQGVQNGGDAGPVAPKPQSVHPGGEGG